jgi:L-ascorbate metabolism protein UlaG (beta-lactamase superfamily)
MDIIWHGNSCFTCKGKTATVVVNPDKSIKVSLKGDVVLSSIGEEDLAEVKDSKKTFSWPGEYEVSEVPITALKAFTRSKSKEEEEGSDGEKTIIYCFEIDKVKVCHLGDLGHKLTSEITDEIGDVDVLLMPVGENSPLKGKTEEVFDQIEPRVVIPYGDFTEEVLKKALNAPFEPKADKYTAGSSALPEDKTQYVLLKKA